MRSLVHRTASVTPASFGEDAIPCHARERTNTFTNIATNKVVWRVVRMNFEHARDFFDPLFCLYAGVRHHRLFINRYDGALMVIGACERNFQLYRRVVISRVQSGLGILRTLAGPA